MTDLPVGEPGDIPAAERAPDPQAALAPPGSPPPAPAAPPAAAPAAGSPLSAAPLAASALAPPAVLANVLAPAPALAFAPAPLPIDPGAAFAAVATRSGSWFAGMDPRGWRTTFVVAALMIGTVVGVNFVNAAVPLPADPGGVVEPGPGVPGATPLPDDPLPADPGPVSPGSPVEVGAGVTVYPPDGWSVVGSEQGQVVLQKAGVVLIAIGGAYDGTPEDLATEYRDAFGEAVSQFSAGDFQSTQLGNGIPSVVFPYVGIADGSQVDGVIAAGVASGTGVILNILAPTGQLGSVSDDLDVIGNTVQITPGGQG